MGLTFPCLVFLSFFSFFFVLLFLSLLFFSFSFSFFWSLFFFLLRFLRHTRYLPNGLHLIHNHKHKIWMGLRFSFLVVLFSFPFSPFLILLFFLSSLSFFCFWSFRSCSPLFSAKNLFLLSLLLFLLLFLVYFLLSLSVVHDSFFLVKKKRMKKE